LSGNEDTRFAAFERELGALVESCQHPVERRIRYGNLRSEISENRSDGTVVTNAAVVYETPGGSTTQINVSYHEKSKTFTFLSEDLQNTVSSRDPEPVVQMIREHTEAIPDKRLAALRAQIDGWMAEGKSRRELFGEMNKLLQTEFLGGRITNEELKAGIQHIVRQHSRARA
jgi:hypothetical protein